MSEGRAMHTDELIVACHQPLVPTRLYSVRREVGREANGSTARRRLLSDKCPFSRGPHQALVLVLVECVLVQARPLGEPLFDLIG